MQALVEHEILLRVTLLLDGITAVGVVFLGAVLFQVLKPWGPIAALTGLLSLGVDNRGVTGNLDPAENDGD